MTTRNADPARLPALDGLRGLAAAAVVVAHTYSGIAMPVEERAALFRSPLSLLQNAEGAVQVFFVLSGFVLAASLARSGERPPWWQFYLRRGFRIHLPYAFGVLFAWLTSSAWRVVPGAALSPWFPRQLAVRVQPEEVAASLLFPGVAAGLLPVGWTLRVEMIFSLLLPLLVLAARPGRGLPLLAVAAALLALDEREPWWYAFDFALGVVAFEERHRLLRAVARLPRLARAALPAAGAAVLCVPLWLGWSQVIGAIVLPGFSAREVVVMAAGAALLVVSAVAVPGFAAALACKPVLWLGRVSYSLYLVHHTVIKLALPRLLAAAPQLPAPAVALAMLALSLAVAVPAWWLVERPAIAAGPRACRWLAQRRAAGAGKSARAG